MSRHHRLRTSRNNTAVVLVMLAVGCLAACDSGGDDGVSSSGPFDMTFNLDASFQAPHGGQPISWALVRSTDGLILDEGDGTVSATQNPSFSFSTGNVMQKGVSYEVHYWIDSNINGGALGVCDPKAIDHQWSTEFLSVMNDIMFTTAYNPALTEDVCTTFTP